MNKRHYTQLQKMAFVGLLVLGISCERPIPDDVEFASYPNTAEVYFDGFLPRSAFIVFKGNGAKDDAFSIDDEVVYEGTKALRFDVPSVGEPGSFSGGFIADFRGRNLTEYDALTFWAKGSRFSNIDRIGFGSYYAEQDYRVMKTNVKVNNQWQKFIIPIPDPTQLTFERGLFWFADGPDDGVGHTFWVDEVKYEKLGTIAQPKPAILNGQEVINNGLFIGAQVKVTDFSQTFNMADGQNNTVLVNPSYFKFQSSNTNVALVNALGEVSIIGTGTAEITATLADVKASGSLTIESLGRVMAAPVPTYNPADVIAVFSDAYDNVPVRTFLQSAGQTTGGIVNTVSNDAVLQYSNLNYAIVPFNGTVNASNMTHLHLDVQVREPLDTTDALKIELTDIGPNQIFEGPTGSDDSGGSAKIEASALASASWRSIDIPLDSFTEPAGGSGGQQYPGNPNLNNLARLVFVSNGISEILVDNVYFFKK